MLKYTILIVYVLKGCVQSRFLWQTDALFPFDFLGPVFNTVSPWHCRRAKIYKRLTKKEGQF